MLRSLACSFNRECFTNSVQSILPIDIEIYMELYYFVCFLTNMAKNEPLTDPAEADRDRSPTEEGQPVQTHGAGMRSICYEPLEDIGS